MAHSGLGSKRAHLYQVMAVLPQTPSKRSHPGPYPSFSHHTPAQAPFPTLGGRLLAQVCVLFGFGHAWVPQIFTLGRRELGPAHLCCLHLAGEPTFHFRTGGQTEGLQRTICMPVYITEYWIVTSCVLILWIFFF